MHYDSLGKDLPLRLSLETNKISNVPLGNEWDTNFRSEIERTLGEIQNAFIRSAEGVLRSKILKTGKKHNKNLPHKKWFNLNCKQIRTNLQRLGQKISKTPKDPYLREQFFKLKRIYRSTCRKEKRKFEQNILQKLETLYYSNNKDLRNLLKPKKVIILINIVRIKLWTPIQDLGKHYKELLQKNIT